MGGRDGTSCSHGERGGRRESKGDNSALHFRYLTFICGISNRLLDMSIWSSVQGTGRTYKFGSHQPIVGTGDNENGMSFSYIEAKEERSEDRTQGNQAAGIRLE